MSSTHGAIRTAARRAQRINLIAMKVLIRNAKGRFESFDPFEQSTVFVPCLAKLTKSLQIVVGHGCAFIGVPNHPVLGIGPTRELAHDAVEQRFHTVTGAANSGEFTQVTRRDRD